MDKKELFDEYQNEKRKADLICVSENIELKQFYLGRASVYKELWEQKLKSC